MITKPELKLVTLLQNPWFGAAVYLLLGLAWIAGSDAMLAWLISDTALLTRYQSYKGYFYVTLTAVLAWLLLSKKRHYVRTLSATQLQAQQQLVLSERRLRTLLDNAPQVAIQGYYADGTTFYWNKASELIYGYSKDEAVGCNLLEMIIPSYMQANVAKAMIQMAETGIALPSEELVLRRKDGSLVPVYSGHAVVKLPDTEPQIYCIDVDLTERKKQAAELVFLAEYDVVTQLPNRQHFHQCVTQALAQADKSQSQVAVLLMDLDNFKDINDSYGHSAGDQLLMQVSHRLQRCCAPSHTLARLGGDEFAVLVSPVTSPEQLTVLAEQLLGQLQQPCLLGDGKEVITTASIGISLYPDHAINSEDLIRAADAAMYKVKHAGRNHTAFYSDELTAQARYRVLLESKLRQALKSDKLECYYQPQIDIQSGRLIGAEVLLRWHDAELGFIAPTVFIPLAESCGLIHALGRWVLQHSCRQFSGWLAQGYAPFSLAVNVSAHQFGKDQLLDELQQVLQETGMPPQCLELEVTESALLLDETKVVALMQQIKALGIRLAIDDFGTGYSSLSYLKRLPLDVLKIDRRFIEHIPHANDDKQITSAIIALAHSMNFKVLAEGVETAEQLAFLRQQACDYYQGYYYSKPLPAAEFVAVLKQPLNG